MYRIGQTTHSDRKRGIALMGIGTGILLLSVPAGAAIMDIVDKQRASTVLNIIKNYKSSILKYANKYGIQPSIVVAIIAQESGGDPHAQHPLIASLSKSVLSWTDGQKWTQNPDYGTSKFNRAWGLMGVLYPVFLAKKYSYPTYFTKTATISELESPDENILRGILTLKEKLQVAGGNMTTALKLYGQPKLFPPYESQVLSRASKIPIEYFA